VPELSPYLVRFRPNPAAWALTWVQFHPDLDAAKLAASRAVSEAYPETGQLLSVERCDHGRNQLKGDFCVCLDCGETWSVEDDD
jgi:hypothetical protein